MEITIDFGSKTIYADGYTTNPKDKTIHFYRNKDYFYIPHIKVSEDMLSDFGRKVIKDDSNGNR